MKKRMLSLLLVSVMLLGLLPTAALAANNIASGTGWVLDADGKLTISSDDGMADWENYMRGNYEYYTLQVVNVEIQDGVTSLGNNAFFNYGELTGITIADSVTSIAGSAFSGCWKLRKITIPNNVTSISDRMFMNSGLEEITIPGSVTSIGEFAFWGCGLTEIMIPASVKSIGEKAFIYCDNLNEVIIKSETPPTLGDGVFTDCGFVKDNTQSIHVPEGKAQAYKTAWTDWAAYIADHAHSWSSDWTQTETHHWHECSADNCPVTEDAGKSGYGLHTWDGDEDTICNDCGYIRNVHRHPICGESCGHTPAHEAVTWKPLTQDSFTGGENGRPLADSGVTLSSGQYKLAEGHYYLAGDVSLDKKIYIGYEMVDLCLNGHTLTNTASEIFNAIEVSYDATLDLCDCVGGGEITAVGAKYTLEIKEDADSFANLYGGTVSSPAGICVETRGNLVLDGATLKAGGDYVINAQSTSTVTIKSGKVEGSRTKCVQMTPKATFAMTDGTITNTGSGCGVSMSNLGGTVSGGTIHSDNGIGIDLAFYSLTLSGNPTITGGEAGIRLSTNGAITVGEDLEGTYSVLHANWRNISESRSFTFTTAASADHSKHFTAATKMTGIAVRNSGEGSSQQLQLYMPHNWSSGWTKNTTHHWHICHNSAEGNCTISDYAACGEEGAAYGAHQWAYETNAYQHRQKCTVCSYAENSWTPHTWDDSHDMDCNVCGYERTVPLYGTVTVTGTPKLGVKLTAAVTGAPEGVTLKYTWTAAGSDAVLGADNTYTPTADQVGKTLTVTVTTEDERYTGSLTAVTAAVDKGDQTAPVGIFTINDAAYGQTNGTIAITGDATKLEYRLKPTDGGEPAWENAASSNTLPAGTYEFRYKETSTHYASPASEVRILVKTPDDKALSIDPNIKHGTVTKRRDEVTPGLLVNLTVKPAAGYELTALAANHGNGQTITPDMDPANSEHYTFTMPNADVTVTAAFTPITYTIDYQWEGVADGSFTVESQTITLVNATRTGYTLSGWAFAEGGAVIENVTAATLMEQVENNVVKLYPVWTATPSHTHAWDTVWSKNATHHWHECTTQGCDVTANADKDGYAEHTKAWVVTDAAQHWETCAVCGWEGEKANHVYDNDQDTTCNICGYERSVTPPTPDQGEAKGEVEVKPDTPAVSVDEDALKNLAGTPAEGQRITVKLTVEKQAAPADQDALEAVISGKKDDVLYLDLSLLKQVNDQAPEAITDTGDKVLEIQVPYDFTGKKDVTVYRKHGSAPAEKLAELTEKPTENFTDGSFYADSTGGKVYIYASKFSTYAIAYTAQATTPSRPSGSSTTYYTLTAKAGQGGAISPSGKISVRRSGTKTFAITPDEGYLVADVLVDGKSVGAVTEYTFEKTTANHTIEVSFKKANTRPAWNPFEDVKAENWFHDSVKYVYEQGLMVGTDSTHFAPGLDTSRAMIATIIWRLAGSSETEAELNYPDCVTDSWYATAVTWGTENGVLKGYDTGDFGPDDPITREQLALMLWRYAGSPVTNGDLSAFADGNTVSSWVYPAMEWAVEQGVLIGKGGGILDPQGQATRAEVAAMFMRYSQIGK